MELKIYKKTIIYIVAPANVATGGVELLHQLYYKLQTNLGIQNVFIKYVGQKGNVNPTPKDYDKYDVHYALNIEDNENNILIVPEVFTKFLDGYSKIRKVIRWLSVDNYYFSIKPFSYVNILLLRIFNSQKYIGFNHKLKSISYHLVQCEYIKQHLLKKGIKQGNISYLSDYLNSDFLNNSNKSFQKDNIIAYNPKKGGKFLKPLKQYMLKKGDNVTFVPIIDMDRNEVISLLEKSKLYVDFGYFPGKDRIPREALILHNIVLISKMGAGNFYEDFPINESFKVTNLSNYRQIRLKILNLMDKYTIFYNDLKSWYKYVCSEEKLFDAQIKNLFKILG